MKSRRMRRMEKRANFRKQEKHTKFIRKPEGK
jgi:hypothetical protein